ncbi:MAG TPA: SusE domain-containing protein [Bacteroidales bacterium]
MKKFIKYFTFIGMVGLLFSCQKQESKVELTNTISPKLTVPSLSFTKDMANDQVVFTGTKVDPGFTASATYYLEVDTAGNNFKNPTVLASSIRDSAFEFSVSDLNKVLLNNWLPYVNNSVEFRIRAVLDQTNAGAGVSPVVSISPSVPTTVVLYGLPQLNLVAGGVSYGYVRSSTSDAKYSGFVKLNPSLTYSLTDAVSGKRVLSGKTISVTSAGYYKLEIDTVGKTITQTAFNIGIIGLFDNWSGPDPKMDYNARKGYWYITYTLSASGSTTSDGFKFRSNDSWSDLLNLGVDASNNTAFASGAVLNLKSGGSNILIPQTGKYLITITISDDLKTGAMTATLVSQ